jgi:aryl-alcohol dehydrogenase-like predicted oxidoreductase
VVRRPLGRRCGAEILLTPIGFGAFKIGRNVGIKYARAYELPSEEESARLLNAVLDLGINYIDTAPAYGLSEERIGRALAARRDEFVVSTKVGETFESGRSSFDFSAEAVRRSVHRSLERLGRERLDLVFIHSSGEDKAILRETDAAATLLELREAGLITAIGFSGKTPQGAEDALAWADALMIEHHLNDRSHEEVIRRAHDRGVGVIVKKPLASGRLPPEEALAFVLGYPGVTSAVVGGLDIEHIASNVRAAAAAVPD